MADYADGAAGGATAVAKDSMALRVLRDFYGYDSFRPGQGEVVEAVLSGRDCVAVMPTGAGKSLCYQVPALVLAETRRPGGFGELPELVPQKTLTLVVSPLVSLMSDQVSALVNSGIPAAYLNSQLTYGQQTEVLSRATAGAYALLYVAPERLTDPRFAGFAADAPIAFVAVDEAHCVSQWGQDFRLSYLGIGDFIANLPQRPVVAAFTATATPRVAGDIERLLNLDAPVRVFTGFDRPNLHFAVEQLTDKKKLARLGSFVLERPEESGIIYCSTRKAVESVCESLQKVGIRATRYHAGLANDERAANQRAFVNDDAPVMVATNAFGMGIDKSNVRYVVHYNMPGSLEAYYQEAGRAGRDGEPSECLLLWNDSDIATARFFIEQESGNEALTPEEQQTVRASQRRRLAAMTGYCMTTECLRAYILRYFGDSAAGGQARADEAGLNGTISGEVHLGDGKPNCGNCSNCEGLVDSVDVTKTARSVMRCVHELRGRFGKGIVVDVLRGSQSQKIKDFGLTQAKTYNIVEDSAGLVKEIIELLTAGGYLEIAEGRYPLVGLGPRAREAAADEFRLYIKRAKRPARSGRGAGYATESAGSTASANGGALTQKRGRNASSARSVAGSAVLETEAQEELFERLRRLRKQLADAEGVPPYIVFNDAALRSMCVLMPSNEAEFLDVNGVGEAKLKRYGQAFLSEINSASSAPEMAFADLSAYNVETSTMLR